MGLRVKLRRTFTSKKNSAGSETGPNGEPYYTDRKDIQYYKPHEIPKSKYRGKVDPEHQPLCKPSLSQTPSQQPGGEPHSPSPARFPQGVPSHRVPRPVECTVELLVGDRRCRNSPAQR
ncbi:hypothetical protein PHISCL_10361 [Aspergillus sclerotialis]|uniref:Uncharacterized protein n=1 Tax=Aspergillus sclerotialis TaxID=2070753 RepID=A0A3A2Z2K5_9EURO|nr:hypothetical protein PHISCL_10361 [Aspergillus sclerotialis]